MSLQDYNSYVKHLNNVNCNYTFMKMSKEDHWYISRISWITVFFQIIKTYQISKIKNSEFIQSSSLVFGKKVIVPSYYTQGSNLYSEQEGILIKWLELNT